MRAVIQRSKNSSVVVDGEIVGEINSGMVVLACFEKGDTEENVKKAIYKLINVRMFDCIETKKMNINIKQAKGEILVISQFTLSWNGEKGHRPGFENSLDPLNAKILYEKFCFGLEQEGVKVAQGIFGAYMIVNITNDGPVTLFLTF
ncbi:MAG: D-tyrosyl-tRNA(Tyr) deacylase [Oligoflexia bacterium]|nr:D-tyrosyl-tRNA(Tyr) deacylase [Oligoflexia bacterium]